VGLVDHGADVDVPTGIDMFDQRDDIVLLLTVDTTGDPVDVAAGLLNDVDNVEVGIFNDVDTDASIDLCSELGSRDMIDID
jgi:hypothetical protein